MSDSVTPRTVAHQAPLSLEFSRQEYWSRLPCPSPGDLPNPGIKPRSPALQADYLPAEPQGTPSSGERNGNPLQYSCLKKSMDRAAWRATVRGVTELDMTEWLTLRLCLQRLYPPCNCEGTISPAHWQRQRWTLQSIQVSDEAAESVNQLWSQRTCTSLETWD